MRAGLGNSYKAIIATTNTALELSSRSFVNSRVFLSQTVKKYSITDVFERRPIKVRSRYTDYIDSIIAKFLANQK